LHAFALLRPAPLKQASAEVFVAAIRYFDRMQKGSKPRTQLGCRRVMNIDSLSLDHMRAALAVAESGSFSEAARRLRRAQSALSYAVITLEQQLGVALFDRSEGGKPQPNETGRVLLREMEVVVRRADEIKSQAKAIGKGLEQELDITVDAHFPIANFVETLSAFAAAFPTVQLRLNVEAMGAVQQSVLQGNSAIGIIGSLPYLPPGLIGDALAPIVRLPVAAAGHPLVQNKDATPLPHRLLLDHVQLVLSDRSSLTAGRDFAVYAGQTWRISDLGTKRIMLLAGLGWGYMPEHMVGDDIIGGDLRRLNIEGLRGRNSLGLLVVHKRNRPLGPASRWMIARLRAST
jgi:DNA-binding transcriptional LysR family regulator